ncbi:hypothetical protein K7X08_032162 [Anisodus acutangulus]|uniref:Uncharacterized protein n=1 Tax=Anisodus acutangulus TaxID=402998 RepID=A0A9Q1MMH8_9SOLA|nr:hypothetical protein K7X08_032162 [Anisodus acutangulus]
MYFRRKLRLPVWSIGPIPWQACNKQRAAKETEKCIKFLDEKEAKSVLYISFGSQSTISTSQMMELAKALDNASGVNFIWVVRPPLGFDINLEFKEEEWLPEGAGITWDWSATSWLAYCSRAILQRKVLGTRWKEIRRKACEVKEMIGDASIDNENFKGSSVKAMDEFLNAALSMNTMSNGNHLLMTSQEENMKKMSNDVRINGNMSKN